MHVYKFSHGIANLDIADVCHISRCKLMNKRSNIQMYSMVGTTLDSYYKEVYLQFDGCSGDIVVAAQCCSIAFFSRSLIVMTVAADTLDTNFYLK
mgnify:CR=1 FL=1